MKFDKSVHLRHRDVDRYNVRFTYNRLNMRRLYKAINSVDKLRGGLGQQLLFPCQANSQRVMRRPSFTPFNTTLNQEQCDSVAMILGCKGTPPYVIHGPPGTGNNFILLNVNFIDLFALSFSVLTQLCN